MFVHSERDQLDISRFDLKRGMAIEVLLNPERGHRVAFNPSAALCFIAVPHAGQEERRGGAHVKKHM